MLVRIVFRIAFTWLGLRFELSNLAFQRLDLGALSLVKSYQLNPICLELSQIVLHLQELFLVAFLCDLHGAELGLVATDKHVTS